MKVISFDQVKALSIPPETCFDWASQMIAHKKEALLPAKVHMSMPGNAFCNVMPSIVGKWGGVKMVTRYPERRPSLDSKIVLFDTETGSFEALMDGNWITAMRTGAVATHTVLQFARSSFSTVGMIGLGNVARSTLLVLAAMVRDRDLNIRLYRYKDQAEQFVERFRGFEHIHFTIVDEMEKVIRGSDVVISCATYFENDIASDDWFDEGVLVVPVHTRGFMNCDLFFDKVYADDTDHVADFRYFDKFRSFAEVCDVVNGLKAGRESDRERIVVYNIGISLHDICFAANIVEMLKKDQKLYAALPDADIGEPREKYWV